MTKQNEVSVVCTAPIGKNLLDFDPKRIAKIAEINNEYTVVIFDVKIPFRVTRTNTMSLPLFGICTNCGTVKTVGVASTSILRQALLRVDPTAASMVRSLLK